MNNNFLGIRGLYKTHMDGLKPFNSKSVTYTYIRYTEHNSRGQPIVRLTVHATWRRTALYGDGGGSLSTQQTQLPFLVVEHGEDYTTIALSREG